MLSTSSSSASLCNVLTGVWSIRGTSLGTDARYSISLPSLLYIVNPARELLARPSNPLLRSSRRTIRLSSLATASSVPSIAIISRCWLSLDSLECAPTPLTLPSTRPYRLSQPTPLPTTLHTHTHTDQKDRETPGHRNRDASTSTCLATALSPSPPPRATTWTHGVH
ncbi:hypothetical protein FB45DRAFT_244446 [Roridomyces roridus]|uniref:Uncharacterized protein n=1 Tax=Roridomyces roridus TaxID=1738132 RepID=A0AAD7FEH0_9AGAR|nr:hypothetical protein FB45DRAFT_244446 [Roridomyces roridus]